MIGIPYRCPICEGRGIVPGGFYTSIGQTYSSNRTSEQCRQCFGTGIIWGSDPIEVKPLNPRSTGNPPSYLGMVVCRDE